MTDTKTVLSFSHKEEVQKYVPNLIFINIGLLMYDVIWIMTTLAIEGGEQYLLKILNLGCVGLIMYDICALMALMKLQVAISSESDSSIDCDDPSKTITLLRHLVSVFLFLSIAREFNSLIFPSSLAVILPVSFLILGSVVFALKIYLLYSCQFTSLRDRTKEQPVYRITLSSVLMAIISIYSCMVNAYQGYDSYQRWLSNKHPAFTAFLAVYCTIYTVHMAYEGNSPCIHEYYTFNKFIVLLSYFYSFALCYTCLQAFLLFGSCLAQGVKERRALREVWTSLSSQLVESQVPCLLSIKLFLFSTCQMQE